MTTAIAKFAHLKIPLEDVVNATNNFHDDNIIGRGGFGPIYKGDLLRSSGELIKISALRLDRKQHKQGYEEFMTEISMLSDLKHPNIVVIVGFYDEKDEKIIVTAYQAKNGSLKEHLNRPNLTWTQRLNICLGVARALSYLHYDETRGYGVIHLNINSSTILLDENWEARLSGFKVSIKQSFNRMDRVVLSELIGTIGYMDPEIVKTKGVTCKSDIYAFGVVLFEILCGRRAYIKNEANRFLAPLAKHHYENKTLHDIIHPDLRNQMSQRSLDKYSYLAYYCLTEQRARRPNMNIIVYELEGALEFQLQRENLERKFEHLKIPLTQIQSATNDFSEEYIVEFSDEYIMYRAEVNHYDTENHSSKRDSIVLIKRYFSGMKLFGEKQFLTEIEVLSGEVKHPNIVTLLGFCLEDFEMILVIDNFSNGSLADYLYDNKKRSTLTWEKRLKICIDVAHALKYIHYEMEDKKLIINRDICGYNIGLDENLGAKIVAFGCSALLPPNQDEVVNLEGLGRSNYIDPEYEKTDKLKRESDVYGFGVVLFEILCGRRACDPINKKESDKGGLAYLARQSLCTGTLDDMIDPIIKEGTSENNFVLNKVPNKDSLDTFIDIAHQCVTETQDKRPTMKVVVKQLEKALLFQVHSMDRDAEGYGGLAEVAGDIQQLSNKYSETVKQVHYPELSKHTEQDPVSPTDKIISLGSKQSVLEHPKQEAILEEHKVRMIKDKFNTRPKVT